MEKFYCKKNCKVGRNELTEGESFDVLRTIMGECVLIVAEGNKPNIITNKKVLRRNGYLVGTPQLGGL